MNNDIENHIKIAVRLDLQQMQSKEKIILHEVPRKPLEVVVVDMFTLNNKKILFLKLKKVQFSQETEKYFSRRQVLLVF